jgi:hypothetical protein
MGSDQEASIEIWRPVWVCSGQLAFTDENGEE